MGSALKLCEENILNRECIGHYKYILQDMLGALYYMHLLLLRQRERSIKLYMPFIAYYFAIHPTIKCQFKKGKSPRAKLRTSVWMVIAILRMKREVGRGKGL